ncbi:hypothetical protein SO802_013993 [Lithocarpus litseifolius]|uniref:Uncharacterized protein n=1 Tax=Lithocarpus litseifolius TaxID=425828 RepID=A0AAW2D7Q7_9ROSI
MAWALVSTIKDQLSSFIASEFSSIANVKGEVQKLESKFHTIQAMLKDAEKRQVKEEAVKLWLDKLKDVSYQVDDVLDEWNTAMIKEKIEKQQKDEEEKAETRAAKKRKVWLPISIPNLFQHRDIAYKIKELNEKLDEINKEREMYGFELSRAIEVVERPKTTSFVDVAKILGRDEVRKDLVSILLGEVSQKEERSPYVISLVGMGGIGKTTLAQLAYNEVKTHFDMKVWVCVSDSFNKYKIAMEILESIQYKSPKMTAPQSLSEFEILEFLDSQSPNMTALQTLLETICRKVEGKKFFLVLDDVWNEDSTMWEPFKLALKCVASGSRILVTTRKTRVAEIMESVSIINLKELSKEDCWLVFSKIAFFDRDSNQREQLEGLGRQIVEKCKGLPLAAKTLGSLMRFKRSIQEWKSVLDSNLWELEDAEIKSIFAPLLFSYYDLSSPLRRCFSFCAVFPKGYVFSIDELVFMWIAQGYIKSNANMEIEIMARDYFENLAIRSLFQDFEKDKDDGKIIRCKMHDIVHDVAQLMSKNECFTISSDINLGSNYKNARHLQLKILKEAQIPESIYSANNLRTLILVFQGDYNLSTLFQHFRCLRTLNLNFEYGDMLTELPDVVENFIHLRYLYLHKYDDNLPETICNLCNLQYLKVTIGRRFKKLPQGMSKLINLRHLILDENGYIFEPIDFPRGIGKLTSLRTLSHFNISGKNNSTGCKLGELKNLNHLLGSLKIRGLGNAVDACEAKNAQLDKKIGLHTLDLNFHRENDMRMGNDDELVLNALETPPKLEKLSIFWYEGTTISFNSTMLLTKLKTLYLKGCIKLESLSSLWKLTFLELLTITNAHSLKKVGVEFLGIEFENKKDNKIKIFPNLKYLCFMELYEWEEWTGNEGMREAGENEEDCFDIMPCLEELKILWCPKLNSLPNFLGSTGLKKLEIQGNQILSERGPTKDFPYPRNQD